LKARVLLLVLLSSFSLLNAQVIFDLPHEKNPKVSRFGASFQLGVMLASPTDINKFINNYVRTQIGNGIVVLDVGNENISSAVNFNFSPTIKFSKFIFRAMADFAIASKSVTINSKEKRFSMIRFSPGLLLDRSFSIDDKKQFFAGAGVQYHFMSFENTPANGVGGRIESGLRFRSLDDAMYSLFIMYDYANQNTSTTTPGKVQSIDFSGIGLGARIEF